MKNVFCRLAFIVLSLALCASCSLNKMAIGAVSDALGGGKYGDKAAGESFASDSDPQLVGEALPFAVKMYETLYDMNPAHQGLAVTTGSLFVMYANAFVQGPADILPPEEFDARLAGRLRAKALYLRGVAILEGALERRFPGYDADGVPFDAHLDEILKSAEARDVPLFYWTVAGTLSAFALDPLDIALSSRLDLCLALLDKAYALNPDYNVSALDEILFLIYASLPEMMGGDKEKSARYYQSALEKSQGKTPGIYVSWAESVAVPAQDYAGFRAALLKALSLDVNAAPANRLASILAQRKARFMLDNADIYFYDMDEEDNDE